MAADVTREALNLEALLRPIGIDQFFERYWEHNYLSISRGTRLPITNS